MDAYHRMAEVGILQGRRPRRTDRRRHHDDESDREVSRERHDRRLTVRLTPLYGTSYASQRPAPFISMTTPSLSPDFSILHPRDDFYRSGHPTPEDVFFLVEVMDSSAAYDRGTKLACTPAGVAEVWLVDVNRGVVEVCRRPVEGAYTGRSRIHARSKRGSRGVSRRRDRGR